MKEVQMRKVSVSIVICMLAAVVLLAQPRDLDPVMKQVGPMNTALGAAVTGNVAADIATNCEKLEALFKETEAFMKSKGIAQAAGIAAEAAAAAAEAAKAAKAGQLDAAKAAAGKVKAVCKGCHDNYREKDPTGGFRFKGGA